MFARVMNSGDDFITAEFWWSPFCFSTEKKKGDRHWSAREFTQAVFCL
jgi:hypothetical protein